MSPKLSLHYHDKLYTACICIHASSSLIFLYVIIKCEPIWKLFHNSQWFDVHHVAFWCEIRNLLIFQIPEMLRAFLRVIIKKTHKTWLRTTELILIRDFMKMNLRYASTPLYTQEDCHELEENKKIIKNIMIMLS